MKMYSAYSAVIYILIRLKVEFAFSVPPVKGYMFWLNQGKSDTQGSDVMLI